MGNSVEAVNQPFTVIVAERYPIARAALAALLSNDGYRVFQAEDARSALAAIDAVDRLVVLLADLDMPEWRTIVRRTVESTDALIIAMEGQHPYSAMYDLKQRGISLCVQKPILYEDLLAIIKGPALLARTSQAGQVFQADHLGVGASKAHSSSAKYLQPLKSKKPRPDFHGLRVIKGGKA